MTTNPAYRLFWKRLWAVQCQQRYRDTVPPVVQCKRGMPKSMPFGVMSPSTACPVTVPTFLIVALC